MMSATVKMKGFQGLSLLLMASTIFLSTNGFTSPAAPPKPSKEARQQNTLDDEGFALAEIKTNTDATRKDTETLRQPALPPKEREAAQQRLQALSDLGDLLDKKFPASPKVQTALAAQALQAYDFKKGLSRAEQAVTLARAGGDPATLADALNVRSLGAWYTGDYPQAATDSAQVLKARPGDPVATAIYQLSKGRAPDFGAGAAGKAVAAPGQEEKFGELMSLALVLQQPEAKRLGQRASGRQEAIRLSARSLQLLSLGDAQGALKAADAAQGVDAALPEIYFNRALAWTMLKKLDKALEQLDHAINLWKAIPRKDGDHGPVASALSMRSQLQREHAKDYAQAFKDADAAVALAPRSASGYFQRAAAGQELGRAAESILADYKTAAGLDSANYQDAYDQDLARLARSKASPPARDLARSPLWPLALGLVAGVGALAWFLQPKPAARPAPAARAAPPAMDRILAGRYEMGVPIGRGGMGEVYSGTDTNLMRPVAIKVPLDALQQDFDGRARIEAEGRLHLALGAHQNLAQLYDIVIEGARVYLIFELVKGRTLHQVLESHPDKRLSLELVAKTAAQAGAALDHAHGKRVIHRDLKPSNIMLTDEHVVKVMDFGIARVAKDTLMKTTGTISGTPYYMAPEQTVGKSCKESDLYALGVCLYELLTGLRPFDGPGQYDLKLRGEFTPVSKAVAGLPAALDDFFKKALDPAVEGRFHGGAEMAAAFHKAAAS